MYRWVWMIMVVHSLYIYMYLYMGLNDNCCTLSLYTFICICRWIHCQLWRSSGQNIAQEDNHSGLHTEGKVNSGEVKGQFTCPTFINLCNTIIIVGDISLMSFHDMSFYKDMYLNRWGLTAINVWLIVQPNCNQKILQYFPFLSIDNYLDLICGSPIRIDVYCLCVCV